MQRPLASIQLVRFAAAFAVVFCHSLKLYQDAGGDSDVFTLIARHGALGVPVFFVISGFVIYGAAVRSAGAIDFMRRRLARIYPPLWGAVGLFLLITWILGGGAPEPANIVRSLTLLDLNPTGDRNALFVAWTLSFEILFYVTVAGLLLLPSTARLRAGWTVLALSLVLTYSGWSWVPPLLANPLIFSFAFGVAAARARVSAPARLPIAALGAGLWIAGLWANLDLYPTFSTLLFGGGTALLFAGTKGWDFSGRMAASASFSGDMSYALYLTHPTILAVFERTGWQHRLAALLSPLGMVAVYCAAALTCGLLFHLVVERGLMRLTLRPRGDAARLKAA